MSINKKRIAQWQQAAAKAAKKDNKKITNAIAYGAMILGVAIVFTVALVLIFSGGKTYYADITIQDYGTITVQLDSEAAPITCENFVDLAQNGFYDGLTFHRIIKGFMIQGGDPDGNGTGGSDKQIKGEFPSNGWDNPLTHTRGTISMARTKAPDSATSQFFIVHEDSPHLDGDYAAFGKVIQGMEVVDAICQDAKPIDNNGTIPAQQQPVITSITISKK